MFDSKRKAFSSTDYAPKRLALKYNPPQIVLEYLVPSSGKLYHHKIKLKNLSQNTHIQEIMKDIYEKHFLYLDYSKIKPEQILRLVEKLLNNAPKTRKRSEDRPKKEMQAINEATSVEEEELNKNFDYQNEDLNKLTPEEVQAHKDLMEKEYKKHYIPPDDPQFQYEKEESFDNENYSAEWDESL